MTKGQGVEAKAKATILLRFRAVPEVDDSSREPHPMVRGMLTDALDACSLLSAYRSSFQQVHFYFVQFRRSTFVRSRSLLFLSIANSVFVA